MEDCTVSRERLRNEQVFHDRQASERARRLRPEDYCFTDEWYLRHESWIAPAFAELGDITGLRVLDLGCGHGMAAVVLARRGGAVTACDLSLEYVREARSRADANSVQGQFLVCDGEHLPFADATFQRIWGNAILHHLDARQAAKELYRVMAPKSIAVFCEPWGGNRFLNWARQHVPYPGKQRTANENPLCRHDLNCLQEFFPDITIRGYQLFSMLGRAFRHERLLSGLAWCDDIVLRRYPGWQRYCRYMVIVLRKGP